MVTYKFVNIGDTTDLITVNDRHILSSEVMPHIDKAATV
jgi:hypothetical protein